MSKDYRHGKHSKREYYGSKNFDKQCRCHGSCSWCRDNRLHKDKRQLADELNEEEKDGK